MKKQYGIFSLASLLNLQIYADCHAMLEEIYKGKSGFCINAVETANIENAGGNATYGEITDEGVQKLIDMIKPTAQDVFYDLGSGVGRMTTKMYLDSPLKKSVGIELSDSRHTYAMAIQQELKAKKKLIPGRTLDFKKGDILKANLDDATIVYTASTCFSDEFMKKLTNKLAALKKGLKVFTLRPLVKHDKFKLVKEFQLPMTWSTNVTVYWYELQ
jgi:SAM-dependent methyltransferase